MMRRTNDSYAGMRKRHEKETENQYLRREKEKRKGNLEQKVKKRKGKKNDRYVDN